MGRRGRDEGSIYRRKDGRWAGAVTLGYQNGKRVRKSLYGRTRNEVQQRLNKALRDHQQGLPVPTERQTVAQFLGHWMEYSVKLSVRPATATSYRHLVDHHIVPAIGRVQLDKLGPQQVQQLLNERLGSGLSPRTVQYIRAVLRRALGQAEKWGLVSRNVAALVDGPRVQRRKVSPFTTKEVGALLRGMQDERLGVLYLMALTLGLRQGEALGLRWSDVDFSAQTVRVSASLQRIDGKLQLVEPKTARSSRTLVLSQRLVEALQMHRRRQLEERMLAGGNWEEHALVFCTRTGRPLDGVNVTRDFQRMLKALKLPRRRFHDLRHTTASLLLVQKVHPRVVMEQLGHSEIRVTMDTYSHVAPVLQKDAADQMESLLKTAEDGK